MDIKSVLIGVFLGGAQLMLGLGVRKPMVGAAGIVIELAAVYFSPWLAFAVFPGWCLLMMWFGSADAARMGNQPDLAPYRLILTGVRGPFTSQQFELSDTSPVLEFGTQANGVRLPEKTPGVSRHHCRVIAKNREAYLVDLNSTYGTYIWQPYGDGGPYASPQRLQPALEYRLYDLTEFFLGSQNVGFRISDPGTDPSSHFPRA